jgi:hypothetical protein
MTITRKKFLTLSTFGCAGLVAGKSLHAQTNQQTKPDPLSKELVGEFVAKAHTDLERTKELLTQQPTLLNASWDWGNGDFETALEAAGHMGRKDIAALLLDNGARMNVFCAAMLGELAIVKAIITYRPELKTSKGPHGLQLLHHARQGGDSAKEVLKYLQSVEAQ